MINFKFLLGIYPKTEAIEAKEAALIKEYNDLEAYKKSDELARYFELKKFVEAPEFKQKEQEITALAYQGTDAQKKETEYLSLKKSARIVNYYKVLKSVQYKNYEQVKPSTELKEYEELKGFVLSETFKSKLNELKNLNFKTSDLFKQEQEFKQLNKSALLKNYFKVESSDMYKNYLHVNNSDDLKHFEELKAFAEDPKIVELAKTTKKKDLTELPEYPKLNEYNILKKDPQFVQYFKFVASKEFNQYNEALKTGIVEKFKQFKELTESEAFKKQKDYLLLPFAKKWDQTEEHVKEEAYKKLNALQTIKDYLKFVATKEFALFDEVCKTEEVEHYEELEKYINSDEFKEYKKYMLLKFKDKWALTDEFKNNQEYQLLAKSEKVKWYHMVVESPKFDELKAWKPTFSDDFDGEKLSAENWLTRFYWGDNLLHDSYSLIDDHHFNTDGKNISVSNSILKIETRQEKVMGKAWNPMFGFMPREFDYTSGLVNTGKSFRQQYGRFKAKIKMGQNGSVTNAFWMVGNQVLPHVDIVKFVKGKFWMGNLWGNIAEANGIQKQVDNLSAGKLRSGYFIFELEWNEKELIWRINGLEVKRANNGIPNEPMYIQFSAGLHQNANGQQFPSSMEIDWVKCYEKA